MGIAFVLLSWGVGFAVGGLSGNLITSVKHQWLKQTPTAVLVAASCIGGVFGFFAAGQPTGVVVVDALLRTGLAALLVAAIGKVRRRVRVATALAVALPLALVAVDVVDGSITSRATLAVGVATAAAAVAGYLFPERIAWFGSVIGIGVSYAALRLPTDLPSLSPSILVGVLTVFTCALSWGTLKKPTRRRFRYGAVALGCCAFFGTAAGVIALTNARAFAQRGLDEARSGLSAAASGDVTAAETSFASASISLRKANVELSSPYARISRIVPVVSQHVEVLKDLTATAATVTETANTAAGQADLEQLRVAGGAVDIQKMVALRTELDATDRAIADAKQALARARSPWLVPQLTARLDSLNSQITKAEASSTQVNDILNVVPPMLGEKGSRRYLLLLPTPAETRGSGGVFGNWGELNADNGRLTLSQFGRTVDLFTMGVPLAERTSNAPADYTQRYARFAAPSILSNATMSPDFPTVASVVADQYRQATGRTVDGVISMDPIALQALLGPLGSLEVAGWPVPLTSSNTAAVLLHDAYVQKGGATPERLLLLEDVTRGVWSKLLTGAVPNPRQLIEALAPAAANRHLQLWMREEVEQRYLNDIGLAGSVPPIRGDSLGVVVNNGGESKIDYFLKRSVKAAVVVDPATDTVSTLLTVTLRNDVPPDETEPYIVGSGTLTPVRSNRVHVSVYSALPLTGADVDGQLTKTRTETEFGRNVYNLLVVIPPGESRTVSVSLSGRNPGVKGTYRLDLFSQPMANPDSATVSLATTGTSQLAAIQGWTGNGSQLTTSLQPAATETFEAKY
jgi:hypothetical protein